MICRTTSTAIWIRNPVFVVLVSIGVGYLWICWIISLHGREHNDGDSSHHSNAVVKSIINVKTNIRSSIHLPTTEKHHGNNVSIDDFGSSILTTNHDDEIINMKRSLLMSDEETQILQEELENNNIVKIIEERDASSMKMKGISHGGDDKNDGDDIMNDHATQKKNLEKIKKEKEERALNIIQNGNTSTSIYHYFKRVFLPSGTQALKILYWKPDGHLDDESLVDNTSGWWNVLNYSSDNQRQPTEYGTIAMLKDDDFIFGTPWDLTPPVPVLFFSMSNEVFDPDPSTSHYKLVLIPEDRNGANIGTIAMALEAGAQKKFEEKSNVIIWRGTDHGEDNRKKLIYNMSYVDSDNNTWLDAKDYFTHAEYGISTYDLARDYKYHLDIGGVSGTTWVALRWKMCSGDVVFKVTSWSRDWWHEYIVPWEHYIPVKEDLSDLYEQYVWAETHPEEAYEIGQKGQKVCLETSTEDFMASYEAKIIQSLPPATKEVVDEMYLIREGYITLEGWS